MLLCKRSESLITISFLQNGASITVFFFERTIFFFDTEAYHRYSVMTWTETFNGPAWHGHITLVLRPCPRHMRYCGPWPHVHGTKVGIRGFYFISPVDLWVSSEIIQVTRRELMHHTRRNLFMLLFIKIII